MPIPHIKPPTIRPASHYKPPVKPNPHLQVRLKQMAHDRGHVLVGEKEQVTLTNGLSGLVAFTQHPSGLLYVHVSTENGVFSLDIALPNMTPAQLPKHGQPLRTLALELAYLEQFTGKALQALNHNPQLQQSARAEDTLYALQDIVRNLRRSAGITDLSDRIRHTLSPTTDRYFLPSTTPHLPNGTATQTQNVLQP